jgi:WD40 repeat protein
VAFGPGGQLISAGPEVNAWNLDHRPIPAHTGAVNSVAFRPGGRQLATAGDDGTVRVWDVATREPVATFGGRPGAVRAVAFSTRGLLAAGGDYRAIQVWNAGTHKAAGPVFAGPGTATWTVAFSPDGSVLAAGGTGGTARLWHSTGGVQRDLYVGLDVRGRYRLVFAADTPALTAVGPDDAVSFDYRTGARLGVLAAGADRSALLRDLDQAVRLAHPGTVLDAASSDDRHTLATVDGDGTLLIWDTNPDRVAAEVCAGLDTELAPKIWHGMFPDLPHRAVCGGE